MGYTEKQVADQQAKNDGLRQQIADLASSRLEKEADALRAIKAKQLEADERQLQTELDYQLRLAAAQDAANGTPVEVAPAITPTPTPTVAPPAPTTTIEASDATTTGKGK